MIKGNIIQYQEARQAKHPEIGSNIYRFVNLSKRVQKHAYRYSHGRFDKCIQVYIASYKLAFVHEAESKISIQVIQITSINMHNPMHKSNNHK